MHSAAGHHSSGQSMLPLALRASMEYEEVSGLRSSPCRLPKGAGKFSLGAQMVVRCIARRSCWRRAYSGSQVRVQKLAGSRLLAGDGDEFLNAFAIFDFARVDIALRVHGD